MADNDELIKPVIRIIIVLFILVIINAIVKSLPGIHTQIPGMYSWSVPAIISAVISLIMIVMIWRFVVTIGPIVQKQYPKFPDSRKIVMYIGYLVCLVILYGALRELLIYTLYNFTWIYDLAFLIIGLYLVYLLATLLMKNSDKLSDVVLNDVKQATAANKVCQKCGTENPLSNNFCDKCGSRLG